jgi:CubicO group peptidase (beta-lactamase class C family)
MWTGSWAWGKYSEGDLQVESKGQFEDSLKGKEWQNDWPHSLESERIFDLASLTKVVATSSLLNDKFEKLRSEKRLKDFSAFLAWPLGRVLSQKEGKGFPALAELSLGNLWDHSSGLAAHGFLSQAPDKRTRDFEDLRERVLTLANQSLDQSQKGTTVYSDLGFFLLAFFVKEASSLDESLGFRRVWQDFCDKFLNGSSPTGFLNYGPIFPGTPNGRRTLSTELRHGKGYVNDDNAFVWGGDAPHAGLFGSIDGLLSWIKWVFESRPHFANVDLHAKSQQRFYAGWDHPSEPLNLSQAGFPAPDVCIGHLGFTGTGLWLDLENRKFGVLLTNRVFPSSASEDSLQRVRLLRRSFFSTLWQNSSKKAKINEWAESLRKIWTSVCLKEPGFIS